MRFRKVAIALAASLALCGCGGNGIERQVADHTANERFICDDGLYAFETVVDSHTGVTYLIWVDGKRGGITVLLNRDGSPVISEEV